MVSLQADWIETVSGFSSTPFWSRTHLQTGSWEQRLYALYRLTRRAKIHLMLSPPSITAECFWQMPCHHFQKVVRSITLIGSTRNRGDLYDFSFDWSAERIVQFLEERWHGICKKHSAVAQGQTLYAPEHDANAIERKDGVRPSSEQVLCKQLQLFVCHCQQLSWAHWCNVRRWCLR